MSLAEDPQTEFVAFWNDTLAAKFERYREILMNGLNHHSAVWLEEAQIPPGSRIVDVGCGWGDTARALAHKTGSDGHVLGLDCVDQFLRKGPAPMLLSRGWRTWLSSAPTCSPIRSTSPSICASRASG